jgi:hypothetical protein
LASCRPESLSVKPLDIQTQSSSTLDQRLLHIVRIATSMRDQIASHRSQKLALTRTPIEISQQIAFPLIGRRRTPLAHFTRLQIND